MPSPKNALMTALRRLIPGAHEDFAEIETHLLGMIRDEIQAQQAAVREHAVPTPTTDLVAIPQPAELDALIEAKITAEVTAGLTELEARIRGELAPPQATEIEAQIQAGITARLADVIPAILEIVRVALTAHLARLPPSAAQAAPTSTGTDIPLPASSQAQSAA